ncbi:hypothetical protein BaRGS_00009425 [Batillaria attramentaria]|uniref:Uncharacterized protein n=1 Tax=Batillaria attramentaria TaxID=370345 RepID=A0ABD0LJ22_9CAEN
MQSVHMWSSDRRPSYGHGASTPASPNSRQRCPPILHWIILRHFGCKLSAWHLRLTVAGEWNKPVRPGRSVRSPRAVRVINVWRGREEENMRFQSVSGMTTTATASRANPVPPDHQITPI